MKNLTVVTNKKYKLDKRIIHSSVRKICSELNISLETLQINFVDEATISEINIKYLNHNYATDIITFNYSGINEIIDAEIFICIPIALENAILYKVNLDSEILRLIVHGILHLVGYDDTDIKNKKKMKVRENELVKMFEFDHKNVIIRYDSENS